MPESLLEINKKATIYILRNRDLLMSIALDQFEMKKFGLMGKAEDASLKEQLNTVNSEITSTRAILEQPLSQEYISLGLTKDIEGTIKFLEKHYETTSEETEKIRMLSMYKLFFGLSREQGISHIESIMRNGANVLIEEVQITVIRVWTLKYYLGLLNEVRKFLQNELFAENPILEDEKIEWLGTQKNLAELFIELKNKGFINEIKQNVVKGAFTKSDTINQCLKPASRREKGEDVKDTFEHVFTSNYQPKFDLIRPLNKAKLK